MPRAIVGIGGNLGARRAIFACAEALLASEPGCTLLARSKLYESAPLGPPQPDYLNAAFALDWLGDAHALFEVMRRTEQRLGRERRERWGPRTLDLDLLEWSEGPIDSVRLAVPHPEIARRNFVLAPLLDVAPDLAAKYEAALRAEGGPPPLAEPGWLEPADPGFLGQTLTREDLETRAALLVRTVAECGPLQ